MVPHVGLELEREGHLCELGSHAAYHHPVACMSDGWYFSGGMMTRLAEAKLLEARMHGTDSPQCQSMQMSCS